MPRNSLKSYLQDSFLSSMMSDILAALFPRRVISSPHINRVISNRRLFASEWGYHVCPSVTHDHPQNTDRMHTGKSYPTKFRAYTTRRCCIGSARDGNTCTDLWAIYGWVIGSMKAHLPCQEEFTNWLCTMYIFYMQTDFIDWNKKSYLLPEIYHRFSAPDIHVEINENMGSERKLIDTFEFS